MDYTEQVRTNNTKTSSELSCNGTELITVTTETRNYLEYDQPTFTLWELLHLYSLFCR